MPFALITVGVVFLCAGVRGTQGDLFDLIKKDFNPDNGKAGYAHWILAILIIGALGYIDSFRNLSRSFLVLIVLVLLISNGGFFQKFNQQFFSK